MLISREPSFVYSKAKPVSSWPISKPSDIWKLTTHDTTRFQRQSIWVYTPSCDAITWRDRPIKSVCGRALFEQKRNVNNLMNKYLIFLTLYNVHTVWLIPSLNSLVGSHWVRSFIIHTFIFKIWGKLLVVAFSMAVYGHAKLYSTHIRRV